MCVSSDQDRAGLPPLSLPRGELRHDALALVVLEQLPHRRAALPAARGGGARRLAG